LVKFADLGGKGNGRLRLVKPKIYHDDSTSIISFTCYHTRTADGE